MRESNFAFPTQNKACVCISSQLYDRRALDTTSALPLFNSLTHLTYLTSTSPRIREIMTMDGGLERLVRLLHDFCICPPPPENAAILYGLTPPNARPPKPTPTLNPASFDKQAAYRFSLAFQCVVNIGVRGSEPIRSRVVQAGTLDVVGCILEAWLANKGFAVGPSSSATGMPRETREQRQARRDAHLQQRQREQAAQLARELQRQIQLGEQQGLHPGRIVQGDESMDIFIPTGDMLPLSTAGASASNSDTEMSTDASTAATPVESGTPTGSVVIPSRDRSGTIIARPVWDPSPAVNNTNAAAEASTRHRPHRRGLPSPPPSTDTSRAETETEDDGDGDGDIDMDRINRSRHTSLQHDSEISASPSPEPHPHPRHSISRRAVGIVSDEPAPGDVGNMNMGAMELSADAHIIINDVGDGGVGVRVGVEDGLVSLEPNDDFAMGAPPGAPGAIDEGTTPRGLTLEPVRRRNTASDAPDVTPRAGAINLPLAGTGPSPGRAGSTHSHHHHRATTARTRTNQDNTRTVGGVNGNGGGLGIVDRPMRTSSSGTHHGRDMDAGPYRDEDVLLSLQLLAYLSKYPHVRQAFYKPRVTFHPASVNLPGARYGMGVGLGLDTDKQKDKEVGTSAEAVSSSGPAPKETHGFFRAFGAARGKEKEKAAMPPVTVAAASSQPTRQTNVFSLVERFTFKPSSTETDLPNPPPRLPPEIQYWAGVIMRNACRKDDSRGGIRQCANMLCGRWETYPREFAKCRRCRKAKYCGKECQSTAWSEGHRFWCSAKDGDDDTTEHAPTGPSSSHIAQGSDITVTADDSTEIAIPVGMTSGGTVVGRAERRERDRHREVSRGTANGGHLGHLRAPAGGSIPRPAVAPSAAYGTVREDLSHDRVAPPIIPPPVRTRGMESRPRVTALHNVPAGNYANFDAFLEQGGRRRAETVTGAMVGGMRDTPLLPLTHHNIHSRAQPAAGRMYPLSPGPIHQGSTPRPEAGPSRRRRADNHTLRPPVEDHDMVIG